jgi:IS1 family transposase
MNVLPRAKRLQVLAALVDSASERAVERMTGVNRLTVSRLAMMFGEGAQRVHDAFARNLSCSIIQVDEIWGYVVKKEKRVKEGGGDAVGVGDAYTFVALDTASRLVISFLVGKRNDENTQAFVNDLRRRLVVMPAMTSDGWQPYIRAIGGNFGGSIDYAQTVKNYTHRGRRNGGDDHRYEPPRDPFIVKKAIYGAPDLDHASTAYVERFNGTARAFIGRMKRLAYCFSKDIGHHRAAWALAIVHYNFCHVVKTLRVTPAMQAGIADHVWGIEEFFDAILGAPQVDAPTMQPLAHRKPETTSRELPGGRGFLRVVKETGGPNTRIPPSTPATPAQVQLGLFEEQPKEPL